MTFDRFLQSIVVLGLLAACSGKEEYVPPVTSSIPANSRVIDLPKDQVWASLIPKMSATFFVINTIDKASGLISVSYSGDPMTYIDCGSVHVTVTNARGERHYDFPAASAENRYEEMPSGVLLFVDRRMALEGRVNVIVEEVSSRVCSHLSSYRSEALIQSSEAAIAMPAA